MIRLGLRVRAEDAELARVQPLLAAGCEEIAHEDHIEFVVYGDDLPDPQHIFQLVAPDLVADFPPLRLMGERAIDAPRLMLPAFLSAALPLSAPPAPFVAREQELAALAAALATAPRSRRKSSSSSRRRSPSCSSPEPACSPAAS